MPQLEFVPSLYEEIPSDNGLGSVVSLRSRDGNVPFDLTFEVLRPSLFRTTFTSSTHPLPPYPSARAPKVDQEWLKSSKSSTSNQHKAIEIGEIAATIDWHGVPVISIGLKDSTKPLYSDLGFRSYVVDGLGVAHYTTHDRNALHVGLGEKRAPMDLTGRFFNISATDCFGYEVYHTDPMYKHMPFLVKATPEGCVAIFSTTHSRASWAVGSEIDGLWGHFKVYRQDYGGLEQYIIIGHTLKDIVKTYADLVGYPIMAPRWAYGYLSGGYKYTMGDSPPAYQQIFDFIDKLKEHDIPCSGHQMSSGYSIAEVEPKVRNVFTWNSHRFPDPEGFARKCHKEGIRLMTNIKPFVLASHPDYKMLAEAGGLFTDGRNGQTAVMRLWSAGGGDSGTGSHIDFTNPVAYEWWKNAVTKLKRQGIDAMWNDNNEYTLPNDEWKMSLKAVSDEHAQHETNHVGLWGRSMHTELMAKASYEGLLAAETDVRPFVLTRSATIGTLRYASSSWSGDNITSWEGMKGANALSLNAGVSLMHCYGHDIGGFEGPQPSPELLLRWVQLGVYSLRFAINCFKTSPEDNSVGEVIEPWMYPEITGNIRKAIKRRYELMPYIYSLALEGHLTAIPPQRWIGWGYESDPEVWTKRLKRGEEQYWFGDALMIGSVNEPGVSQASIYLPRSSKVEFDFGYINLNYPHEHVPAGGWVTINSRWQESIPVLAKVGSVIPVGKNVQTRIPGDKRSFNPNLPIDDYRGLEIFPPKGSSNGTIFSSTFYDDDGLSLEPKISSWVVAYSCTDTVVLISIHPQLTSSFVPPWTEVVFILPYGDDRTVISQHGKDLERIQSASDERRRYRYQM